jgi:outer membrane receptor protein involved in Fe transport
MFSIPLMLNVHWYGGSGSRYDPQPFLGLNAGVTYLDQTLDIGVFSVESDAWVVAAMPEAGIMLGTSGHTRVNLHVRYHFPFTSQNLLSQGAVTPACST